MKKAKRILTLMLAMIMVMGCISVSAASTGLTVSEKPVKVYYESDFSNKEDSNIVIVGENGKTEITGGKLKITEATAGVKAKLYAKENMGGIAEPVFVEFDISHDTLFSQSANAINMFFVASNNAGFIDATWLSNKAIRLYQDNANQYNGQANVYSMHFKIKIDPVAKKYATWVNGVEITSEDEYNYIRNKDKFIDFAYMQLKTAGNINEIKLDNFIVYSEPQTAFPMVEELYNEPFDGEGGSKQISTKTTWNLPTNFTPGSDIAYEIDITGTSGKDNTHGIVFGNATTGCYTMANWNSAADDSFKVRVWDPSYIWISEDKTASEYNANAGKLKVTAIFNDGGDKVDVYANGMFVVSYDFQNVKGAPEYMEVQVSGNSTANIDNVRVYRYTKGLNITEKNNSVKIVTSAEKSGNLYFAKYDSNSETGKTLESLGVATLNLKPGKVYTIDKTDWAGAKAFFWDGNLTPIVDSWALN